MPPTLQGPVASAPLPHLARLANTWAVGLCSTCWLHQLLNRQGPSLLNGLILGGSQPVSCHACHGLSHALLRTWVPVPAASNRTRGLSSQHAVTGRDSALEECVPVSIGSRGRTPLPGTWFSNCEPEVRHEAAAPVGRWLPERAAQRRCQNQTPPSRQTSFNIRVDGPR